MLRNYLVVALRNLRRERSFALINIFGLAIGLAICLLVMAYVVDEWTFDSFHANADCVFRVNAVAPEDNRPQVNTPFPLRDLILDSAPSQVEGVVQWISMVGALVTSDQQSVRTMVSFADSGFFEVFSFSLLAGDSSRALGDPGGLVLSADFSQRLFGSADPVGRRLSVKLGDRDAQFVVTAVAAPVPDNSTLEFQLLLPMSAMNRFFRSSPTWNTSWPETFVLARPGSDRAELLARINSAAASVPRQVSAQGPRLFELQPLTDLHLRPDIDGSAPNTSSPTYSLVLCLVAFVILETACINFTTLAIGRAQRRVREIGTRKVMGAGTRQIIFQILGETIVISVLAMIVAFVLAELSLPYFNTLSGKSLSSIVSATGAWGLLTIWLVFVAAFFAGFYPALVLSRVKMTDAMRGKAILLTGKLATRVLVVAQFTISAALIVITICLLRQIDFVLHSSLGFEREGLVMLRLEGSAAERFTLIERLRAALGPSDGILSVAASSADFTGGGVRKSNRVGPDSSEFSVFINPVDQEYVKTMGLQIVDGSDFDRSAAPGVGSRVIVNETFVRQMNWENPIGRTTPLLDDARIVGVVKDYHIQPFSQAIEPIALVETRAGDDWAESLQFALLRLETRKIAAALARIQTVWSGIAPHLPFDYEFMDSHIEAQYRSYLRWAAIIRAAATLAIVVACFGVFGLTALAAHRRRKELIIRRILGAKSRQLILSFYREFALLALIGAALGMPLAYWFAQRWSAEFVYRAAPSFWPYVIGGAALLGVVLATVTVQAARAASSNVAEIIHCE